MKKFWRWLVYSVFISLILLFISIHSVDLRVITNHPGSIYNLNSFNSLVLFYIILASSIITIPFTSTIYVITVVTWLINFGSLFIVWGIFSLICGIAQTLDIFIKPLISLQVLLVTIVFFTIIIIPWRYYILFHPKPAQIIKERVNKGVFDIALMMSKRDKHYVVVPRHKEIKLERKRS